MKANTCRIQRIKQYLLVIVLSMNLEAKFILQSKRTKETEGERCWIFRINLADNECNCHTAICKKKKKISLIILQDFW